MPERCAKCWTPFTALLKPIPQYDRVAERTDWRCPKCGDVFSPPK